MESMRRIAGLVVSLWLMGVGGASAVTLELSGKLSVSTSPVTPQALIDLNNTPYTAYLTYDENASPTSGSYVGFAYYANQGSFVFNTALGAASGNFPSLQTFLFHGVLGEGSEFRGEAATDIALTGPISSLSLIPDDFMFQFEEPRESENIGLKSFALPAEINLEDFDGPNFVRLSFSPPKHMFGSDTVLFGTIDSVSAVPEPHVYAMMFAGLGLLGWRLRQAKK